MGTGPRYFRYLLIKQDFDKPFFERHIASLSKKYANSVLTDLRYIEPIEEGDETKESKAKELKMEKYMARIGVKVANFFKTEMLDIIGDIKDAE